ncbi:tetratricopeptide repeat protein [Flavilitoribacter nigricans]|uniref:Tetratricopeptide repeat protein n=1 Tax=Flavilitoribacter nigricans (strain ATCC 23147 / DSM 23189 / NBRC 102662 / NCIMB 1420 / SS-2) TaxID=1122177 RepID=A0A2D0NG93_FLAN2|nr:tetratricopeptide repeat protein [Flavilitoribacter nigricans]PHN07505.1 tetratricopeptide repeat protein [Flavilitoribacter nigricans DSM 23189 = NBRC 102662]
MDRLEKLLHFLGENPGDNFILFAIAKEYEKMGDDDRALTYFEKLREENAAYVGLYYHLGKLWERKAEPAKAFRIYTQGMDIARRAGDQHALSELAGARLILGDEDDFEQG